MEGAGIAYGLANTSHTEIAQSLPLPNLPINFGAANQELLFDENDHTRRGASILFKAGKIAELLAATDISHLTLRGEESSRPEPGSLAAAVLELNPRAFSFRGQAKTEEKKEKSRISSSHSAEAQTAPSQISKGMEPGDGQTPVPKKPRLKRKEHRKVDEKRTPDPEPNRNGIVSGLCELVNEFMERSDAQADPEGEEEGTTLSLQEMKSISEEVVSLHSKYSLHRVPVGQLVKLLSLLDRHVRLAHLKEIDEGDDVESENFEIVMTALESVQISLMIMSSPRMAKQIYKEEFIDRLIEFTRYQIVHSVFTAYDPVYRQLHKNAGNAGDGDEVDEEDEDEDQGRKNRRKSRAGKVKKSTVSRVSNAISTILQKICVIVGLLKDLLFVEKLLDSTILQLMKTVLDTFAVDNIQLLQLKAIGVACMVFSLYPQHQTVIIDEILSMFWKIPSSKKNLRTYHLPEEEPKQIQMLVGLLLQLVQCCVSLPDQQDEPSTDTRKCFEPAISICNYFWTNVLQRWAVAKAQDGSDVKAVMENLVIDLLTTINVPEFPAASLLLQVLCVLLLGPSGVKSKDVSVRVCAIDLLGQIAAHLKRDAVAYFEDELWILQELKDSPQGKTSSKDNCAICGNSKANKLMLRCGNCKKYFHGDCVGVTGQDLISRGWFCQCCLCRKQLGSFTTESSVYRVPKDGTVIVQQILLNYLQENGRGDDVALFARRFYACLWYGYDQQGVNSLPFYYWRLEYKAPPQDFGLSSTAVSRDSIVRITRALGQQRPLARGFDRILERLLACLQENASNPRAKALKAVSAIVEVDPGVLADERVQKAVEGRFMDSAISVREAAMELVGRHIISRPDVAIKYFDRLSERIMDTGVSVRKRVIKIIRDFCLSKCGFPKAVDACIRVISRINDEEASIQDLVCKTFYEMWFEEQPGQQTQFVADGSLVPLDVAERAQQLVEVLKSLPNHNHQPIVTIIRRSLTLDFIPQGSKTAAPTNISQATVRNRCELMCKYLMECILKVEETSEESEVQAMPYVSALHAFCTVDPTLCAPASDPSRFAVTLQPYLKTLADNRDTAQLLQSIVYVIDMVLPLLRRPAQSFVEELERDLRQLIVRYSFLNVVHACIRCLCSLTKISSKGGNVFGLLVRQFYKVLHNEVSQEKPNILRSLFCLGLFVRYGAELIDRMNDHDITMDNILGLYIHYLQSDDFDIKVKALQAVGFIFLSRPDFMMVKEIGTILEKTLTSTADSRIKMQTLRNFHEYLLDVEKQMGTAQTGVSNEEKREFGAAVPIAAGAGDSNICGGIIQLHWDRILERCLDREDHVRQSALKVVDVVLRQGLVHPMTCVPQLIALEVDQLEVNCKLAHRLLCHLNEKYPSFFESRLGDGLQLSFQFVQSSSARRADQNESAFARAGVSRIYKLIRGNRNSRNKFLASVVRKFDWVASGQSSVAFLVYCTEILAALPFTLLDEPLYLIFAINRILQVRAGDLEANMKAEFAEEPLYSFMKRLTDSNETDENALPNLNTNPIEVPQELLKKLQDQSDAAVSLCLLLKMKRHLKVTYCLDDSRCQAFQPSEAVKSGEVVSRQAAKDFNCSDLLLEQPQNITQIIQRYQMFKALLKADTMDYSSYAPTPANKKRSRLSAAQADGMYQGNGHAGSKMRRKSAAPGNDDGNNSNDEADGDYAATVPKKRTRTPGSTGKGKRKSAFVLG